MKKLIFAICAAGVLTAIPGFAGSIYLDRVSGYYYGDGGEFNISPVNCTAFDQSVTAVNRLGNVGYESFCMQVNEDVTVPGTYSAWQSQNTDDGVALSVGVAYLYSEFVSQDLANTSAGYDYTPGAGRGQSAWALQNAIWYLQGENDASHTSGDEATIGKAYLDLVATQFGDLATAQQAATTYGNTYGVSILNLYIGNKNYQSQLTVPDGGATAMLLGMALAACGLISRKLKKA